MKELIDNGKLYPITKCPYCGNDEFYVKCRISGVCHYNLKLDGSRNAYNAEMYDKTDLKIINKYAYCNNCGKRLFKLDENMKV